VEDPSTYVGCSDATREAFLDIDFYPLIAACNGAWDIPGIHNETPACDRQAGNSGENPLGEGCNVTDLCAEGWHVCLGKMDVTYRSPTGCDGIMVGAESPAFFLTRTSSTGAFNCSPDAMGSLTTVNDIFGCGDLGCPATADTCAPLTLGSHDGCKSLKSLGNCSCAFLGELDPSDASYEEGNMTDVKCSPSSGGCGWCKPLNYWNYALSIALPDVWDCGGYGSTEANDVIKTDPNRQGGVLCCKDQCAVDGDCPDPQVCIMSTCQDSE